MATQDIPQTGNPKKSWEDIASEITQEQDPGKLRQLTEELNQAMPEE